MIFETPWFIYHVWILEKRATRWRWWPSLTIFLGLPDQAACRLRHQQQLQIIKNWSFGIIYKLFQFHHRHYDFKYHMVSQKMLFKFSVMYSFIHSPFSFLPLHVLATFTLVNKISNLGSCKLFSKVSQKCIRRKKIGFSESSLRILCALNSL